MKLLVQLQLCLVLILGSACSSYEQFQDVTQELEIPSKVFKADYNQAWQAVLLVMRQYDLDLQNQESGVIKTRWIDNTVELNFADSFGSSDAVKSARFKIIINVVKGFRSGREVSKISVFKRQMIEQDFLQGWKVIRSDGIQEETILYRISRLIQIDNKLKEIEEQKSKEAEATF